MTNYKNAKEVREKVEEIKKKRTKCTKNENNPQKKGDVSKKMTKKEQKEQEELRRKEQEKRKKRTRFLIRLLVWEYVTASIILLVAFNYKNIKSLERLESVNKQQQLTITTLVNMLNARNDVSEVEEKRIEYTEQTKKNKGTFRVTAYCACEKCCGKWATLNGGGYTASGTKVQAGRTIAVYKSQIPFGTEVYIEGLGTYIAEDTGSAIKENCIDVYFDSHTEALNFGVKYLNVEY